MIRRREVIIGTGGGFTYFFCHGVGFLTAGLVSFAAPAQGAALLYAFVALPALVAALGLARVVGTPPIGAANELWGLLVALYFVPLVAMPAAGVLAVAHPHYAPLLVATVFGAHLVPFGWLLGSRVYGLAGVLLVVLAGVLYVFMGKGAFHFVGLIGGVAMIFGAWLGWRHATGFSMRAGD